MREALNNNPVVQAAVVGVLGIFVAFLLITRVAGQGGDSGDSEPATQPTPSATEATTAGGAAPPAAATTPDPASAPGTATTSDPAPAAGESGGGTATVPAQAADGFVAGPGLPPEVVSAYAKGDVVVLLITRYRAIDDRKLEAKVEELRGRDDVALFTTLAVGVARYSRITQGVDVDRTPALVVIEPRRLADGPLPAATVSYGFRGAQSVEQAVRDALYSGGENLPAYPR